MKLPHLHILSGDARAERHAHPVAGIDMRVSGGSINTPRTACREDGRLRFNVNRLTCLDADRHNTNDRPVLIFHQVNGKPFVKENGLVLNVVLVQRVEQRVTGTVRRGTGSSRLPAFAIVL